MKQHLSEHLTSRTFIGLLLAQFTATFNDQAIHMVAVFYAVDMLVRYAHVPHIDEKFVVALVTTCFITPFLLFSSYAGTLGDRFSKRSVIVFWKVAEVGMMSLALFGLALPHLAPMTPTLATWSAGLVIATVFLMGMHSTFFVPAKLGAMPEILHPSVLSAGNGLLEGTSFTAQILGTSTGGILYALWKGDVTKSPTVPGEEWKIGVLLLGLALAGTITAALMRRIPAAAPDTPLSWNWWRPLWSNLSIVWRSKPLTLSVTGIAFCVFMTLFLRQTLLYQGELKKELETAQVLLAESQGISMERAPTGVDRMLVELLPAGLGTALQEPELRVALLFALVGLGVGLGSLVAGFVSGHRVELGLVPLGALAIVVGTILPAIPKSPKLFVTGLFVIGFGAGFYLVPLYTLLQHRAPKESKGNVVSASNFVNVLGGVVAVFIWSVLGLVLDPLLGADLTESEVLQHPELTARYVEELERQLNIPRVLYLTTSILTVGAMWILVRKLLPDFFLRSAIWLRAKGHNTLRTAGLENMPIDGPVVLLADCASFDAALDLIAAVDRYPRVILVEGAAGGNASPRLRRLAERAGLLALEETAGRPDWDRALDAGLDSLARGDMVALTIGEPGRTDEISRVTSHWRAALPATIVVPVACCPAHDRLSPDGKLVRIAPCVVFGAPLAAADDVDAARVKIILLSPLADQAV